MFRRYMFMEIAPSGAPSDAGVSGPGSPSGAPPTPAPQPSPQPVAPRVPFSLEALDDGGAPPARRPQQPATPGGAPATSREGAEPNDNPIPYSRVREMLAQAVQRATGERDRFYEQQFRQLVEKLPQRQDPMKVLRQIAPLLGIEVPEEQPQFMTAEALEQRLSQMEGRFGAAFQLRAEHDQAQSDLTRLKAQNPDYFDEEGKFEALVADVWGADPNRSFVEAFNLAKGLMDSHYDRRTRAYADSKGRDGRVQPVRGAAPAPRGTTRQQFDLATPDGQDEALDALLDREQGA